MGMGLKFIARREVQVISTGKIEIQDEVIPSWNFTKDILHKIHTADDPVQEYIKTVREHPSIVEKDVFAEDDLDKKFPIGKKTFFLCELHIDRFMDTIQYMRGRGFEIRSFYYD